MTKESVERKLVAILFADIAGYTSLMQQDEPKAREFIRTFNETIKASTSQHKGEVVQFYGDGCICTFTSAVHALACGKQVQTAFQSAGIPVRIGVHSGDAYFDQNNIYGDSVNLASRIESIAVPGSVLFSERIKKDIKNQPDLAHQFLGPIEFKNIEEPVRIYALDLPGLVLPESIDPSGKIKHAPETDRRRKVARVPVLIVVLLLVAFFAPKWESILELLKPDNGQSSVKTVAVLDFESDTDSDELNTISSMTTSRIVHGITQYDLARVVSNETVDSYQKVLKSSVVPVNFVDFLNTEMNVSIIFSGKVYAIGDELMLESTVLDAQTNEIIKGLPTVKGSVSDPMSAIEEQRQLILGYIAQLQDIELNLSLETQPPKYAAYKEFLLAKQEFENEQVARHLLRAIEIDSNYFEPKVYLVSTYYNMNRYVSADSLLKAVVKYFPDAEPRQRNIINFYKALLDGKNNLAYQCMMEEFEYAPFDLPTSQTVMVLGAQYTRNLDEALEVYDMIPEEKLNLTDCDACQIRMYVKGHIELEQGNIDDAIETGLTLKRNNGEYWANDMLIRGYAMKDDWNAIDDLLDSYDVSDSEFDVIDLSLKAAKEAWIVGAASQCQNYANYVIENFEDTVDARLVEALWLAGDTARAWTEGWKYLKVEPETWRTMSILTAIALLQEKPSDVDKLLQLFEDQRAGYQYGGIDYALARAYGLAGQTDISLKYLNSAIRQGKWNNFSQFQSDFVFVELRDEGEFKKICNYWNED